MSPGDPAGGAGLAGPDGDDAQRGEPVRVGLFARGKASYQTLSSSLGGVGEVRRIRDLTAIRASLKVDVLVVEVDLTSVDHIHSLKACRESNPSTPVIVLGRKADADVAVEVCKLLDLDYLSSPHETDEELRLKCERGMFGRQGPTLQRPFLAPLVPEGSGMGMDRRKVFRAIVPSYWSSNATVVGLEPTVQVGLEDISIPFEGQPGGMLLRAGRAEAQAIARSVKTWGKGARLDVVLDLSSEEQQIPLACRVIRVPKPRSKEFFHFAVQYETEFARHDAALMRFWTNCQMQARRKNKPGGRP